MKIEIKRINKDQIEVKTTQEVIETKSYSLTELQIQKEALQKRREMDKRSFDNALAGIDEEIAKLDGLTQELVKLEGEAVIDIQEGEIE